MNIFGFLYLVVLFLLVVLLVRMIFDWVHTFTKTWEPVGPILFVHDLAYGISNPPLKFVRRAAPPLKIGRELRLDVAFLVVVLLTSLLLLILNGLR